MEKRDGAVSSDAGMSVRAGAARQLHWRLCVQRLPPDVRCASAIRTVDDAASIGGKNRRITYYTLCIFRQARRSSSLCRYGPNLSIHPTAASGGCQEVAVWGPRSAPKKRIDVIAFQDNVCVRTIGGSRGQRFRFSWLPHNEGKPVAVGGKCWSAEVSLGRRKEPQLAAGLHAATGLAEAAIREEESRRCGKQAGD